MKTNQEEKIKLFNTHNDDLLMRLNKIDSLGDAILFILHTNYQKGNKNIGKVALKNMVNHYYGGEPIKDIKVIRNKINELRNQRALIISRGGKGGGYRKAVDWGDVLRCTKSLFHSQAMSLLSTEKAMKQGAQEVWGPMQYKMGIAVGDEQSMLIIDQADLDYYEGIEPIEPLIANPEEVREIWAQLDPEPQAATVIIKKCEICNAEIQAGYCINYKCENSRYKES